MIARGMDNTTVRQAVDRAEANIERNRQEAIANVESDVRQQQAGAFERLSGTEQAAQDRLQSAGLGAGAQMTSAELAGDRQLGGQGLASAERLGQADVGAEAQAIGRAEGAGQQIGLAGLAQQAAGKQGISAAEQATGRMALGEQTAALRQGGAAQLGITTEAARAAAGVAQAGLSAEQQQAMAKLSAGISLSQQEIASIQNIIGSDLQSQQQTAIAGLSAQERMAAGRAAAGQQAGLAGAGAGVQAGLSGVAQQAAGQGALLGADRGMAERTAVGQFGQIGQGSSQQAAMLGQELGERGTGQRQLTGIEGQLAGQGAGGAIGNLAQQQAAQVGVGQQQIGSAEAAGLGLSQTAQNRMDFMERRTDAIPSWESYADLVKNAGASGHGVGSVGSAVPTGTGGGNNAAQQQQMAWMRGQIEAGQARQKAAVAEEREQGKQRLRDKAKERQDERDRDAVRRKEEKAARDENQKRSDASADKLKEEREKNQSEIAQLNEDLQTASDSKAAVILAELADAKLREKNLIKGQEASDAARDKANAEGGRMGNITVNVTTGAVSIGQQEVKGPDNEWKYETIDENDNVSYGDDPYDPWGGTGGTTQIPDDDAYNEPTTGKPPTGGDGFGTGDQGGVDQGDQGGVDQGDQGGVDQGDQGGNQGGKPTPAGEQPKPGAPSGTDKFPEPANKPANLPQGTRWNPSTGYWVALDHTPYTADGVEQANYGAGASEGIPQQFPGFPDDPQLEPQAGTEGVPGPAGPQGPAGQGQPGTGLPGLGGGGFNNGQGEQGLPGLGGGGFQGGNPFLGTEQFTSGNPWGQGNYNDFMEAQLMGGQNEGLAGLADAAGGGAQTTGIVRGDNIGAAGQPQAQAFQGNAMMGQVAQPQAGGQPAGGQQLVAKEPINAQQQEAMMQVMPNLGGDGSALGLGVGGQWNIYQQELAEQQKILAGMPNGGGGGGGYGGGGGQGGGGQGGGGVGGVDGGGGRPGPTGDVIHPEGDPRDIAGTQGGGRPPVFLPGIPGGGGGGGFGTGTGDTQILTRGRNMFPQGTGQGGGGSTAPNTGAGNQWEDMDFAKQGGGGQGSSYPSDPQEWVDPDRGFISRRAKEGEEPPVSYSGGGGGLPPQASGAFRSYQPSLRDLAGEAADAAQFGGSWKGGTWQAGPSMPMGTKQGMVQAPQSMPMAPGLNSLATKAKKPRNITLNQMYRK
tara:strand:+ start:1 stop:3579 length:3579 start_codon:yes stop_codon:yes gene_type:complete